MTGAATAGLLLSCVVSSARAAASDPPPAPGAATPDVPASAPVGSPISTAQGNGDNPAGPNRAAAAETRLSEIVVTATRQSQVISRVPISISAFSQEQMDQQGVKSFGDLVRYTPGVTFDPSTNNVSIRGVASTAGAATTGIYIDDTPVQVQVIGFNSNNTLPAIFDLDRVEVLRGPQGTLFGAGSEGGTVRYITPQPSLTKYTAYGRAEGSTTDGGAQSGEFGLAIGGPIVEDKLGFRISGWYRRDGGYIDRVDPYNDDALTRKNANGEDTVVGRAALTWAVTPNLTITPSVYYQQRNLQDTNNYWVGISNPSQGVFQNGDPEARGDKDHYVLPAVRAEFDFHGASLISNTSYFYRKEITGYEGTLYNLSYFQQLISDPTSCGACASQAQYPLLTPTGPNLPGFGRYSSPNTVTNKQNNFNQEVRLQSSNPDARINYVLGVFYQRNRQLSVEEIHDPQLEAITQYLFGESATDYWGEGLLPNQYGDDDYINYDLTHNDQIAGFADVTFAVTSKLKLEAGLRYARTHFTYTYFVDGAQNGELDTGAGKQTGYPLTPKGSVQYQLNRNDLFYATYAKGYRAGGGSPQVSTNSCATDLAALNLTQSPPQYHADTVDSYELGTKDKLLDHRLQFEGSIYYLRWHNIQQEILLPSCGYQYTDNVGEAESKGFDAQFQYEVIQNLVIDTAIGFTDAKYIKTALPGNQSQAGLTGTTTLPSNILANDGDSIGTPYAAPPWTVSLGAQYNFKLGEQPAFARVDYEFTSHNSSLTPALDPIASSYDSSLRNPPATNFVSLRAGVDLVGINISLFCDNLLDAHPQTNLAHEDQYTLLFEQETFRPRTVGLTATYRYGGGAH